MLLWEDINCLDKKKIEFQSHTQAVILRTYYCSRMLHLADENKSAAPHSAPTLYLFPATSQLVQQTSLVWSLNLPKVGWYKCRAMPPRLAWRTMQGSPCQSSTWPSLLTLCLAWPTNAPPGLARRHSNWPGPPTLHLAWSALWRQEPFYLSISPFRIL
jgi:hypothetical protein